MASKVPIAAPWSAADAGGLDGQTLQSWLGTQGLPDPGRVADVLNIFSNSTFGARARDVSLRFVLAQIAGIGNAENAGSLLRAIGCKGGAQDSRFVGGSQIVSTRLAERLGARVLLGFVGGVSWAAWGTRPRAARRAAVLGDFAAAVGPRALKPMAYVEKDWTADRWTRGGPVSALGPGVLSGFGSFLTRPFNRVHWAGAETATYWNGYMDGAVSSGERAAREAALMARHLYRLGGGAHDRRRPVVIAWAALDGHGARGRRVQAKNHAHRGRPRGAVGSEKVGHGAGGRR